MPTSSSLGRPDVVSGILSVDSNEAFVLFDSGATFHLFHLISSKEQNYLVKKSLSLLELAPLEV